ncbi:MAG: hypothetical protein M1127_02350 [Patescibacteria group bacterium]|nr:hypothetical protein [Patescibacteria group bacterium]
MVRNNIKKKILAFIAVLFSLWFSAVFALGILLGYIGTHFGHKKITKNPRWASVNIGFGKWSLHFHHWLMNAVFLAASWLLNFFYLMPLWLVGMAGGIIAHDLYSDRDWFRIITKKNQNFAHCNVLWYNKANGQENIKRKINTTKKER